MGGLTTSPNNFKMADGGHIVFRKMLLYLYWTKIFALYLVTKMQHDHDAVMPT